MPFGMKVAVAVLLAIAIGAMLLTGYCLSGPGELG